MTMSHVKNALLRLCGVAGVRVWRDEWKKLSAWPRTDVDFVPFVPAARWRGPGQVVWRSLLGTGLTVFFTLLLALPYSCIMVRTNRAVIRKVLLIVLFLLFFIGQVVRAYGLLIVTGSSGAMNDALGLVRAALVVGTLLLTDFAMPAMLGAVRRISSRMPSMISSSAPRIRGLGSALALPLATLGSVIAGVVIAFFGTGTLGGIALTRFRLRFVNAIQIYLLLPFCIPLIGSGIGMMLVFGSRHSGLQDML